MTAITALKLGVSPLSWTNDVLEDLGGDISLTRCLQEAAQAGYSGIELGRKFPRDAAELSPLLTGAGLALASGWYSGLLAERTTEEELREVRTHAQLLHKMGASVMVYGECGAMPGDNPLDEPLSRSPALNSVDIPAYAGRVSAFARALFKEYGLKLAFHQHLMMLVEHQDELSTFLEQTDSSVGLVLDTGHALVGGIDIPWLLKKHGHRICHIHLKDVRQPVLEQVRAQDLSFNDAVRSGLFTVPGDGVIDFTAIIDFIRHSGYSGWLIVEAEQDPQLAPPLATVTRAAQWASKTFNLPLTVWENNAS